MARTRGHGRHGRAGGRRHCFCCSASPLIAVKLLRAPKAELERCGYCGQTEDRCYCYHDGSLDPWEGMDSTYGE